METNTQKQMSFDMHGARSSIQSLVPVSEKFLSFCEKAGI